MTRIARTGVALALAIAWPALAATNPVDLGLEALVTTPLTHDSKYDRKQRSAAKYEQKQNEVAASVTVVTRDEIKAFGWRTLAEALSSLPGIHLTYDRQYTYLGTRGFGLPGDYNTRMLLAINGNRINNVVYDAALIGREFPLDVDLIERIEYIAGPGGAVYGQNAMLGVINVITRSGARMDGGELAAVWQNPQSLREGRFSWGKLLDNGVDVMLSASGMRTDGEDRLMNFPGADAYGFVTSGVATGLDAERDREFFARVGRGAWSLDVLYSDRRKDDPTAMFYTDPLAPGQYERDEFAVGHAQYQDDFAGNTLNVLGRVFLGRQRWSGLYTYSGVQIQSASVSSWYGAELRLLYTGVANHKLMAGLEYQENARIDMSSDDLTTLGTDTEVPGSGYRVGLYAQDEWRLSDTWATTLGLRLDRNDVTGTQWSPRAAVIWQATPVTTVKAMYGRASRPPNAYERDYGDNVIQVSNSALDGEKIDTLELVVDHRTAADVNVRGSVYRWTLHDLVTLGIDSVSGLPQFQSGGKTTATGGELAADKTWDSGARLRASVSYQNVSLEDSDLINSPDWLGRLNYSTPLPWAGLSLGYELQYDSRRLTRDGRYLDDVWLSHLNLVAANWVKGLEVSIGIRNLFDQDYAQPAADTNWQNALEQDGRSVRAKLEYRF